MGNTPPLQHMAQLIQAQHQAQGVGQNLTTPQADSYMNGTAPSAGYYGAGWNQSPSGNGTVNPVGAGNTPTTSTMGGLPTNVQNSLMTSLYGSTSGH